MTMTTNIKLCELRCMYRETYNANGKLGVVCTYPSNRSGTGENTRITNSLVCLDCSVRPGVNKVKEELQCESNEKGCACKTPEGKSSKTKKAATKTKTTRKTKATQTQS